MPRVPAYQVGEVFQDLAFLDAFLALEFLEVLLISTRTWAQIAGLPVWSSRG
jgi:hypothetical protein